jgi:hypothetical protein
LREGAAHKKASFPEYRECRAVHSSCRYGFSCSGNAGVGPSPHTKWPDFSVGPISYRRIRELVCSTHDPRSWSQALPELSLLLSALFLPIIARARRAEPHVLVRRIGHVNSIRLELVPCDRLTAYARQQPEYVFDFRQNVGSILRGKQS